LCRTDIPLLEYLIGTEELCQVKLLTKIESCSSVARNLIWGVYVLTSHCNFKTYVNVPHVNKTVTDFGWIYIPIYPPVAMPQESCRIIKRHSGCTVPVKSTNAVAMHGVSFQFGMKQLEAVTRKNPSSTRPSSPSPFCCVLVHVPSFSALTRRLLTSSKV